jgi:hypothetical protein
LARESMRGKELRRDCENKSTYNVGEVSSESGICTSLFCLCKVYKHGLLQHCRETGLKKENQAQDKDIRKGSMTHQDEGRIEVTIYEDDIVVRGPSHVIRGIREIDIPTILSRVFFEYACAVSVLLVTVRGVIIIIVCLIVVVIERPR